MVAREKLDIPMHVLIRRRAGDFGYSATEIKEMKHTIRFCKSLEIEGVVVGFLTPEGKIDKDKTREVIEAAEGMDLTFHRAFDQVINQEEALETIFGLGFDRALTSGGMPTTREGVRQISQLIQQAENRRYIMPRAGINTLNTTGV